MSKVLIVDDSSFMRASLKMLLESNGYTVIGEAQNGREAVSKYSELKPDIVTMDITMPELSGVDAVKEIMQLDSKAKIIIVSAIGQKAMVIQAIQAGAKEFIVKPYEEKRVLAAIGKFAE